MSDAGAPDWRRNLAAVTVASFVGFTGFTLVMPFLPLYLEELGVHDTGTIAIWAGLSLGVTPAVTALMAPVWARVADRFGRKIMVVRSLFSFVVIMAAMAFVTAPWQVLALRAVQGFFAGYGMLALTMAAESAPQAHMARAIGWVQTAQRLGPALGPLIGGALARVVGLRGSFLAAAGLFLGACVLVMFMYREGPRRARDADAPPARTTLRSLLQIPGFLLFLGTIFALQLVDRSFGPVLPLYLREIGLGPGDVPVVAGLVFTCAAGAAAIGNQLCAWLLSRVGAPTVATTAAAMAAVAAAVFSYGPARAGVLLPAATVFGAGIGLVFTTLYTLAGTRVPSDQRGVAFGYLTTASLSGLAISPVVSGLLGAVSMRSVFIADAVGLSAIALVLRQRLR